MVNQLERKVWAIVSLEVGHSTMAVQMVVTRYLGFFLDGAERITISLNRRLEFELKQPLIFAVNSDCALVFRFLSC